MAYDTIFDAGVQFDREAVMISHFRADRFRAC